MIVCGDAIDVLRARPVTGAQLLFIDPPFNTGRKFMHYADRQDDDDWLSFLRELFEAGRGCLAPEGSVWVNVDERMSHRVRLRLDNVFGAENYIATVMWRKKYKAGRARGIHTVHNPILVYGRRPGWRRRNGLPPDEAHAAKYRNPDGDPRGAWRLTHGGERTYLSDLMARGAMPHTWWDYTGSGHTEQAVKESGGFSTPKPLALMRRIITVATDPDGLVIDPCAGSGTTLVAAQELGRRWFGVEREQAIIDDFIRPRLRESGE
jgi:adenine-specific DNA-methyltransferase